MEWKISTIILILIPFLLSLKRNKTPRLHCSWSVYVLTTKSKKLEQVLRQLLILRCLQLTDAHSAVNASFGFTYIAYSIFNLNPIVYKFGFNSDIIFSASVNSLKRRYRSNTTVGSDYLISFSKSLLTVEKIESWSFVTFTSR